MKFGVSWEVFAAVITFMWLMNLREISEMESLVPVFETTQTIVRRKDKMEKKKKRTVLEVIRMVPVTNDARAGSWSVGGGNEVRGNLEASLPFENSLQRGSTQCGSRTLMLYMVIPPSPHTALWKRSSLPHFTLQPKPRGVRGLAHSPSILGTQIIF